jgi:hypothetical protein
MSRIDIGAQHLIAIFSHLQLSRAMAALAYRDAESMQNDVAPIVLRFGPVAG